MADSDTTSEKIRENIEGPRRATGDTGSVEQHSPGDQADADRYLATKTGVEKPHRGLRYSKIVPPGAGD